MPPLKRRQLTPEQAADRLMAMCAAAEHCSFEMMEKMRRWQIPPADAMRILERLQSLRYVDDDRFARSFVSDKVRLERRGRLYLRRALAMKRIPASIVATVLAEIPEELYADNLRATLTAKIRSNPSLMETFESRTKLFRYLVQRGYEPALAAAALRTAAQSASER